MTLLPKTHRTKYCFIDCGKEICDCKPTKFLNDMIQVNELRIESNDKLHKEFLEDFKQLLKKYNAEFSLDFENHNWNSADVPTIHFGYIENIRYYSRLELPSFIDGKEE